MDKNTASAATPTLKSISLGKKEEDMLADMLAMTPENATLVSYELHTRRGARRPHLMQILHNQFEGAGVNALTADTIATIIGSAILDLANAKRKVPDIDAKALLSQFLRKYLYRDLGYGTNGRAISRIVHRLEELISPLLP